MKQSNKKPVTRCKLELFNNLHVLHARVRTIFPLTNSLVMHVQCSPFDLRQLIYHPFPCSSHVYVFDICLKLLINRHRHHAPISLIGTRSNKSIFYRPNKKKTFVFLGNKHRFHGVGEWFNLNWKSMWKCLRNESLMHDNNETEQNYLFIRTGNGKLILLQKPSHYQVVAHLRLFPIPIDSVSGKIPENMETESNEFIVYNCGRKILYHNA